MICDYKIDSIDRQVKIGGNKATKVYSIITDAPNYIPDKELHPHIIEVHGGTYLIIYHYDLERRYLARPTHIFITPSCDINEILKALKKM